MCRCPKARDIMTLGASEGDMALLKLGLKYGCVWDGSTTAAAASYNHMPCVRWLVEAGCPFWEEAVAQLPDRATITNARTAMICGDLDAFAPVLLYAEAHGAPLPAGGLEFVQSRKMCRLAVLSCFTGCRQRAMAAEAEGLVLEAKRWRLMGECNRDILERILGFGRLWTPKSGKVQDVAL